MPDIKLKNIRMNKALSEETNNYSADLYFNGKKVGQVGNHGTGGPDCFHPAPGYTYTILDQINAEIKADQPTVTSGDFELENDIELVCGDLIERWAAEKEVKKLMKGKALYLVGTDFYTLSFGKHTPEAVYKHLDGKHAGVVILNRLPLDQAVETFVKNG